MYSEDFLNCTYDNYCESFVRILGERCTWRNSGENDQSSKVIYENGRKHNDLPFFITITSTTFS